MLETLPSILIGYLYQYLNFNELSIISSVNKYLNYCVRMDPFYSHCGLLFRRNKKKFVKRLRHNYGYFARVYPNIVNSKPGIREQFVIACNNNYYLLAVHLLEYSLRGDDYDRSENTHSKLSDIKFFIRTAYDRSNFKILKYLIREMYSNIKQYHPPIFQFICANGYLQIATWFADVFSRAEYYADNCLAFACVKGKLDMAMWIYKRFDMSIGSMQHCLGQACIHNKPDIAKWLLEFEPVKIEITKDIDYVNKILNKVCKDGHTDVAKLLLNEFPVLRTSKDFVGYIEVSAEFNNLDVVKLLFEVAKNNNIIDTIDFHSLMRICCLKNGHISVSNVMKWLENEYHVIRKMNCEKYNKLVDCALEKSKIVRTKKVKYIQWLINTRYGVQLTKDNLSKILFKNDKSLHVTNSIFFEHLNIIKCLYHIFPDEISRENEELMFKYVCSQGNLKIAKFLGEKIASDIIAETINDAFQSACFNGHAKIVKWLINTYPEINVRAEKDIAFKTACKNNHLDVVSLLRRNYKYYAVTTIEYHIMD